MSDAGISRADNKLNDVIYDGLGHRGASKPRDPPPTRPPGRPDLAGRSYRSCRSTQHYVSGMHQSDRMHGDQAIVVVGVTMDGRGGRGPAGTGTSPAARRQVYERDGSVVEDGREEEGGGPALRSVCGFGIGVETRFVFAFCFRFQSETGSLFHYAPVIWNTLLQRDAPDISSATSCSHTKRTTRRCLMRYRDVCHRLSLSEKTACQNT